MQQILLLLVLVIFNLFSPLPFVPVTGEGISTESESIQAFPNLAEFSASLNNNNPDQLVGVYIPNLAAFAVVQQPSGNAGFVSTQNDVLTQFSLAADYGSIGLLAHNYLAGAHFDDVEINQIIILVYGDGSTRYYHIYAVDSYRALSPSDPYGSLQNLSSSINYSAEDVFYNTYGLGEGNLILQTCIADGDEASWGRLFLIAHPLEQDDILLLTSINTSLASLLRTLRPQPVSYQSN